MHKIFNKNFFKLTILIFVLTIINSINTFSAIWLYDGQGNFKVYISNQIKRGWFKENGNQYYATKDGNLALGWKEIDGEMYFFDTSYNNFGKKLTGYHYIDNFYYFFDSEGKLLRDDYTNNGYRADDDGKLLDDDENEITGNELSSNPTADTLNRIAQIRNKEASNVLNEFNLKNETTIQTEKQSQAIVNDITKIVGEADKGIVWSKRKSTDDQFVKINSNQNKISLNRNKGNLGLKNNIDLSQINYTNEKIKETDEVIKKFVNNYIKNDMSDFEKEMIIIQYLVENNVYDYQNYLDNTIPTDSYTSYGALVKNTSVCAGYADAFYEMCKAVNIESEIVRGIGNGGSHAWNRVKLDNEWYNVDVTWEDPVPTNNYGFGNLRNKYINLTDEELKRDHTWTNGRACNAIKYGATCIENYMLKGEVNTNIDVDKFREELMIQFEPVIKKVNDGSYMLESMSNSVVEIGAKFNDESNYLSNKDEDKTKKIINDAISKKYKTIFITYKTGTDVSFINSSYLKDITGYNSWWVIDIGEETYSTYSSNKTFSTLWLIPEFVKFAK